MSENESARYNELERMRQLTGVEILEENFSFYIELTLVEKVELGSILHTVKSIAGIH